MLYTPDLASFPTQPSTRACSHPWPWVEQNLGSKMSFGRRLFVGIPEMPPVGSIVSTTSTRSALFPGSTGYTRARRRTGSALHGSLFSRLGSDGRMSFTQLWRCMALSAIGYRSKRYGYGRSCCAAWRTRTTTGVRITVRNCYHDYRILSQEYLFHPCLVALLC